MQPSHLPPPPSAPRRMKILDKAFARQRGRYVYFPFIKLCGKWLQDQGFEPGQQIEVACEAGKLVITVAPQG